MLRVREVRREGVQLVLGLDGDGRLEQVHTYAPQIDQFLYEYPDAMLFVAAGNSGRDSDRDLVPDPYRSYAPATKKNGIVVGSPYTANDGGIDYTKARVPQVGHRPGQLASQRVTPLIMAPGTNPGTLGPYVQLRVPFERQRPAQPGPMRHPDRAERHQLRDRRGGRRGPAGPRLLRAGVLSDRDAGRSEPLEVSDISGALIKAILMLSGDFMDGDYSLTCPNLYAKYRFNYEQGYGRMQLNNVLPLPNYQSPPSMIVADGGLTACSKNDMAPGISGMATQGSSQSFAFTVNDAQHELRAGLTWVEPSGDLLTNNLDLQLVSPSGRTYFGNYFTDDDNKNRALDANEDCRIAPWCTTGNVDASRWSLPIDPTSNVNLARDQESDRRDLPVARCCSRRSDLQPTRDRHLDRERPRDERADEAAILAGNRRRGEPRFLGRDRHSPHRRRRRDDCPRATWLATTASWR